MQKYLKTLLILSLIWGFAYGQSDTFVEAPQSEAVSRQNVAPKSTGKSFNLYAHGEIRSWEPIHSVYSESNLGNGNLWLMGPQLGLGIRGKRKSELVFELSRLRFFNGTAAFNGGLYQKKEREAWLRISRNWKLIDVKEKLVLGLAVGANLGYSQLKLDAEQSNLFPQKWEEVFMQIFVEPQFRWEVGKDFSLNLFTPVYLGQIALGTEKRSDPSLSLNEQSSTVQSFEAYLQGGLRLGLTVHL